MSHRGRLVQLLVPFARFFGGLPPNFRGQHHAKRGLTKKSADKKPDASILSDVKKKTKTLLNFKLGRLNKITVLN